LVFAISILLANSYAQHVHAPDRNAFFVEPGFKTGKMIDIFPGVPSGTESYFTEINAGFQSTGNQWWNSYYNFPRVGVLLSYGYLGNKEVLGSNISIQPNMTFKLAGNEKFSLRSRISLGFSWFLKPYDRITNPENKFIGSRITQNTQLSMEGNIKLTEKLILIAGFSFVHYSTGHVQIPNIGINIPTFNLGLVYYPNKIQDRSKFTDTVFAVDKSILFNVQLALGVHEYASTTFATGGPKYPVYGGAFCFSKRVGMIATLQIGLHVNYYTSFYDYIIANDFYVSQQRIKSFTLTPFAGLELLVGRIGFVGQLGIYAYNPFINDMNAHLMKTGGKENKIKRMNANRLGIKYYLLAAARSASKKPYIGLVIKTNAGQADFVEVNMGYAF
jgi:hypothetical protein